MTSVAVRDFCKYFLQLVRRRDLRAWRQEGRSIPARLMHRVVSTNCACINIIALPHTRALNVILLYNYYYYYHHHSFFIIV